MFDWINYLSLLTFCPMQALFYLRVLTPKIPRGRFFLYHFLYYAFMAAINVWLTGFFDTNAPDSQMMAPVTVCYILAEITGYLVLWHFTASDTFWRKMLAFGLNAVMVTIGTTIGAAVLKLVEAVGAFGADAALFSENGTILTVMLFQCLLLFISSDVIARRVKRIAVDVRWNMFVMLLFTQVASFLFVSIDWLEMNLFNTLLFCIYAVLCVLMDVYILRVFRSMVKNAELEQQVALLDQQQQFERQQYLAASEQMTSIRRLRHDYINTLSTLGTLMRMGEQDKALAMLDNTANELEKTHLVHTGNQIVDAVLYSKGLYAKKKDVALTCSLLWPQSLAMADTDLMRLLSNLLDNAIRYCESLPANMAREVEVSSSIRGRMFALLVSNPYCGDTPPVIPAVNSNMPAAEHGHGLMIARGIAEAYDGSLTDTLSAGTLTFRAVLALPEPVQPTA